MPWGKVLDYIFHEKYGWFVACLLFCVLWYTEAIPAAIRFATVEQVEVVGGRTLEILIGQKQARVEKLQDRIDDLRHQQREVPQVTRDSLRDVLRDLQLLIEEKKRLDGTRNGP